MTRFTLSQLFTSWQPASSPPKKQGWYRTRTEPLTHSWWNGMAYWDGQAWWHFGEFAGMSVRREIAVLQWQGLNRPLTDAVSIVLANMPSSRGSRRGYERFLASLGVEVPA